MIREAIEELKPDANADDAYAGVIEIGLLAVGRARV